MVDVEGKVVDAEEGKVVDVEEGKVVDVEAGIKVVDVEGIKVAGVSLEVEPEDTTKPSKGASRAPSASSSGCRRSAPRAKLRFPVVGVLGTDGVLG